MKSKKNNIVNQRVTGAGKCPIARGVYRPTEQAISSIKTRYRAKVLPFC